MNKPTLAEILEFDRQYGIVNRFALVHEIPTVTVKRQWRPDNILDIDDIEAMSASKLKRVARREFRSLPQNPHTKIIDIAMGQLSEGMDVPQSGILSMLETALQYQEKELTKRQKEAMTAYDEAIHCDQAPVTYVADKLGISVPGASKLLKRAKVLTFGDFVHYVSSSQYKLSDWSPSAQEIKAMMKSKPRICAYCGGKTYDGSVPLCFTCHSQLQSLREEVWDERTRKWLIPEIRRIENEHRQWAVDACYKAYYRTHDRDISEIEEFAA